MSYDLQRVSSVRVEVVHKKICSTKGTKQNEIFDFIQINIKSLHFFKAQVNTILFPFTGEVTSEWKMFELGLVGLQSVV